MTKKIIFVLTLAVFLSLGLKFALSAQKYAEDETALSDYSEDLSKLEARIEGLSNDLKGANREILRKLDQALSNQEKIFQELAIIKVRASKR